MALEPVRDADDTPGPDEDFDAFWAEQRSSARQETIRVFGELVPVPSEMPMDLLTDLQRVESLDADRAVDEVQGLVARLYGPGTLERWKAKGLTAPQFQLLLAWGTARAMGQRLTLAQVSERIAEQAAGGKAPARPAGRRSAGTGRSSRRTSTASTASPRTA